MATCVESVEGEFLTLFYDRPSLALSALLKFAVPFTEQDKRGRLHMDTITSLQTTSTVLTIFEKLNNLFKEWTGKLPEGSTKDLATKDLASVDESLQLAKIELAKGFGYRLCQRHFPPGILLDIREATYPRWKCDTCGYITPQKEPEDSIQRKSKTKFF